MYFDCEILFRIFNIVDKHFAIFSGCNCKFLSSVIACQKWRYCIMHVAMGIEGFDDFWCIPIPQSHLIIQWWHENISIIVTELGTWMDNLRIGHECLYIFESEHANNATVSIRVGRYQFGLVMREFDGQGILREAHATVDDLVVSQVPKFKKLVLSGWCKNVSEGHMLHGY